MPLREATSRGLQGIVQQRPRHGSNEHEIPKPLPELDVRLLEAV